MFYIELERKDWDLHTLEAVWQILASRYKKAWALQSIPLKISSLDCCADSSETLIKKQALLRQELQKNFKQNPAVALKATLSPSAVTRLFIVFPTDVMDEKKFYVLWREWQALYQDHKLKLAVPGIAKDSDYWQARLNALPASAAIAPAEKIQTLGEFSCRFEHYQDRLLASDYRRLKVLAQKYQLSLTVLILVAVYEILLVETETTTFRLNLVLDNRLPLYPYLGDKADYASSIAVLPLVFSSGKTLLERAENLALSLKEDAKHLTTSTLPVLYVSEWADQAALPLLIECNLQQGLRHNLLAEPADIVTCSHALRVNYYLNIWEEGGELCYRCSLPKENSSKKIYLQRLLTERMQSLAEHEGYLQEASVVSIKAQLEAEQTLGETEKLHFSIKGLQEYEAALKAMQQSLERKEVMLYAKQFKQQRLALEKVAGYLWSQYNKPPYAEDLNALFTQHNLLGEMFYRDAFERAQAQLKSHWPHIKNLQRIFKENPPPELHEAPAIKAVAEFNKIAYDDNLSPEAFKASIRKLEQEVFKK